MHLYAYMHVYTRVYIILFNVYQCVIRICIHVYISLHINVFYRDMNALHHSWIATYTLCHLVGISLATSSSIAYFRGSPKVNRRNILPAVSDYTSGETPWRRG